MWIELPLHCPHSILTWFVPTKKYRKNGKMKQKVNEITEDGVIDL